MDIRAPENVFSAARERGWDWHDIVDLSDGVNPLGPAPGVGEAVGAAIDRIGHHPEVSPVRLTAALAQRWQVAPEQIVSGSGIAELIHFTARLWRKETATLAVPAVREFHRAHRAANQVAWNEPQTWPESGLMIFSQPNTLIGQALGFDRIRKYLAGTTNPVIIDESFIEFTGSPTAIGLIGERPNLFVLRSMSYFYALPGLRIGALVGDVDNLANLRERREPWMVSALAEDAALVSLADLDYAARTREHAAAEREWMWGQLRRLPIITAVRSEASFLLIHLARGASDLAKWLLDHKVLVRDCTGWPGLDGDAIRVGLGRRETNEHVVALLRRYITGR